MVAICLNSCCSDAKTNLLAVAGSAAHSRSHCDNAEMMTVPPATAGGAEQQALAEIDYLLFDVDRTFTTHGLMHAETTPRCLRLRDAGITAIASDRTLRLPGQCDAVTWPIEACVTENGGVIFRQKDSASVCAIRRVIHRNIAARVTSKKVRSSARALLHGSRR